MSLERSTFLHYFMPRFSSNSTIFHQIQLAGERPSSMNLFLLTSYNSSLCEVWRALPISSAVGFYDMWTVEWCVAQNLFHTCHWFVQMLPTGCGLCQRLSCSPAFHSLWILLEVTRLMRITLSLDRYFFLTVVTLLTSRPNYTVLTSVPKTSSLGALFNWIIYFTYFKQSVTKPRLMPLASSCIYNRLQLDTKRGS